MSPLTFWPILMGVSVPVVVYVSFIRPTKAMLQVPPVWRAMPVFVISAVIIALALTPPGWHTTIVQWGGLSVQIAALSNGRFIERPRPTSILGLNQKD